MGFFDRFTGKKTAPAPQPSAPPNPAASAGAPVATSAPAEPAAPSSAAAAAAVKPRLATARERLEAKDLPGALALYEEILAHAGDRADVLVTISGDLGTHGHVAEIIELVAPRYAADRHGPATGLNLLQAYLAVRDADAAQHVLDILFSLQRPELEDRLHGFSNAIAELMAAPHAGPTNTGVPPSEVPQVALVSISKPIWFYGLEPLAEKLLPPKSGRLRRIAFGQLALPGYPAVADAMQKPEDELGRLSRALPLWLAETFYFSPLYAPIAAIALLNRPAASSHHAIFGAEWTTDNLRQLADTSEGLDYIVTGALRVKEGDYEILLRVWEVKGFRERKTFSARWTPATADEALQKLHAQLCAYMEWSPASAALAYTPPAQPRAWLETLGTSLGLFLAEKTSFDRELVPPPLPDLERIATRASTGEAASLAFLTARARAQKLGLLASPVDAALARSPLVAEAQGLCG
jgi:hypothetical protein